MAKMTQFHLKIEIKGMLRRSDRELEGVFEQNGRPLPAKAARAFLVSELEKGHKVLPTSDDCVGFDYSGGGCPGHPMTP